MKTSPKQELIQQIEAGRQFQYLFFWGHRPHPDKPVGKWIFSQWYPSSFQIEGDTYPTAEHYMMAEKARLFEDEETRQQVLKAQTPKQAKALGRKVRNFNESLWLANRYHIVIRGNQAKFEQNPDFKAYLIGTGNQILVEASPVDPIWGIGLAQDHPDAAIPSKWPGQNLLGFALMKIRVDLASQTHP